MLGTMEMSYHLCSGLAIGKFSVEEGLDELHHTTPDLTVGGGICVGVQGVMNSNQVSEYIKSLKLSLAVYSAE